jgi:hypothetical protein
MAQSHLIALPSQELSALLCAATAPQFAQLFDQLPSFRAALRAPVDDELRALAGAADQAISAACANTNYPEDWDDDRARVERLRTQKQAQEAAQASAPPRPAPKKYGNTTCPCCAGARIARVYSKACNSNWFDIKHLGFETEGYMPSDMGIPGDGDGPGIEVCLDCGRIVNGEFPLPENVLHARVAKYKEECL